MEGDLEALAYGTAAEASAAASRLLSVTKAAYERRAQLEHALKARVAIEQAKGILAERHGVDVEDAFVILRRAARNNRMKVQDLVAQIKPSEETPEIVLHAIANGR